MKFRIRAPWTSCNPSRHVPCLMFLALFMTRSRVSWPNQPIPCQKQNDTRNALDQKFVRSQLDPPRLCSSTLVTVLRVTTQWTQAIWQPVPVAPWHLSDSTSLNRLQDDQPDHITKHRWNWLTVDHWCLDELLQKGPQNIKVKIPRRQKLWWRNHSIDRLHTCLKYKIIYSNHVYIIYVHINLML